MADQHNPNIPAIGNQIVEDIPDIKENLEFHKDVFEAFVNSWSDTVATNIKPKIMGDADNDTLIQVEEGVDDDIIRFDLGNATLTAAQEIMTLQAIDTTTAKLEPTTNNILDLGSATKQFKDLYIDGVGYIDLVEADTGSFGTASITNATITSVGITTTSIDSAFITSAQITTASIDTANITGLDCTSIGTTSITATVAVITSLEATNYLITGTHVATMPSNGVGASAKFMLGNSSTIAWFYLNTAPPGWKALSTGADTVLAVSGGTGDYNVNGGNPDTAATWTIDGITGGSHNHQYMTTSGSPNYRVVTDVSTTKTFTYDSNGDTQNLYTDGLRNAYTAKVASTSGSSDGTWRPKASVGKLFQLDTA